MTDARMLGARSLVNLHATKLMSDAERELPHDSTYHRWFALGVKQMAETVVELVLPALSDVLPPSAPPSEAREAGATPPDALEAKVLAALAKLTPKQRAAFWSFT